MKDPFEKKEKYLINSEKYGKMHLSGIKRLRSGFSLSLPLTLHQNQFTH